MTFTSDREIERIYTGLLDRSLPKPEWTHAAHFAAAVAMLADKKQAAFEKMPDIIRAYNLATGVENTDTDGYHHTITLASLLAVQVIIDAAPESQTRFEITNAILAQDFGNPKWLLKFWSKDVLFSVEARRGWVEPDIRDLPFRPQPS